MAVDLLAPTPEAVEWVADRLREADRLELEAAHGFSMADAVVRRKLLRAAVLASSGGECWAAHCRATGEPVAILGVAPAGWVSDDASPWLLGTDGVLKQARALVCLGRIAVADWASRWHLINWVDARNTASVRWLERIGFAMDDPAPRGPAGVEFRRFWLSSGARG